MNNKIKNTTKIKFEGIEFKSKLEESTYNTLREFGFNPLYEPKTFILWKDYISNTPFYDIETKSQWKKRVREGGVKNRLLVKKTSKIQGIKYTPDFYFRYKNLDVYIETKGIENDVFYIKKKLFRAYLDKVLEEKNQKSIFFEVYTKVQLLQSIEIIQKYGKETE